MASILLVESYDTGSHAVWMRGYQKYSSHQVEILSLPGQYWQWRMHGGAVTLARLFMESSFAPDLIVASDMLDLTTFLALTRPRTAQPKTAVYFHENQLTYPFGPRIKRDLHLGFINYASALAADAVIFNSEFHRTAFLDELPRLLKHYPDYNELQTVETIREKSHVLAPGVELQRFDKYASKPVNPVPVILWNHRWEYDKDPVTFFKALYQLMDEGYAFKVIVAGENTRHKAEEFDEARERLGSRLLHFGYAESFADYARLVWQSDIVVSTANQDFFGISMCEGIYCGCLPIMPKRLNYPDLVPPEYRDLCLYETGALQQALNNAIAHHPERAPAALRKYASQFDWANIGGQYDQLYARILLNV